jgi:predicted extracellular nuclease
MKDGVRRIGRLGNGLLILILVVSLTPSLILPAHADGTGVFINEIHYDNTGTDTGEAIEIAGPAGTDLTGWSLVLYNGSGGASYGTTPLNGYILDLGGGFGVVVVNYPSNGIQNGYPDGMALVDSGSNVVQFLSYEGTFVAADGPASGMTSTDIGVAEGSTTPVGYSLQLVGTGTTYEDFIWAGEQLNTFGSFNVGQSFAASAAAILVINEVDYDQPSTDAAEFVEIKNIGTASADLSEYTLELVNGNGGGASLYQSYVLPAVTLSAGGYFVVCGDAANVANCDLDVSPDTNLIQNGAPDAVGLRHNGDLVDAVSYEGDTGAPYTEGSGSGLLDDPDVDGAGISRYPDGVDTNANNVDFSRRCITPGEANTSQDSDCIAVVNTDLVINEIDYDQPGTDTAEFVEIRNNGDTPVDLTGWMLELVNGSGGGATVYGSYALSGYSLAVGDYFVVCGNAANVPNCDLDVTPDSNLIQNGAPDAVGLRFNGALIDAVSYEGDTGAPYTEGSGAGLEDSGDGSISRCDDGVDTNINNVDLVFTAGSTPGAANDCAPPPPPEACGDPFTPIYQVQGNGLASPLVGTEVAVEGIVVGDFQNNGLPDNGDLNGFHVQDPAGDGDPTTSDGIFVYAPGGMDVSVGDAVRVRGTVSEYNGMTEVTASQIWVCSSGNSVAPTALSLPVMSLDDFEPYEGMLVTFLQALYISEYFNFDRYGEIVLSSARQNQPTAVVEPGPAAVDLAAANLLDRITLDDGRTSQNPDPAIHPNGSVFDLSNLFRGGDTVQNVTGVLDYSFDLYRIQPTQGADYTSANPRTDYPDGVGGNLKVASFNVLNYFTTIDTGAFICGPAADQECRGADTPEEFTRQRAKIIAALTAIDADVVGLIEIENHPGDVPTADLVSGLNDMMGAGTYDFIATGAIGTDAIRQAFIYKPAAVSPVGAYAILDTSVDPRFLDDYNRPVLAQTFQDNATGGIFTVAVNHLKSKGSDCNAVGDPDTGDGSGNCNLTRKAAAEALVDWLATDPTGSGDGDYLIIGDLNSYDKEDPIDALLAGDYTDLIYQYLGEYAYSYVFDGQLGYLDHALANASLLNKVTGTTVWHINADEPDLIDYDMTFKGPNQDALYAPDPYRSSDHDPVIVGLCTDETAPTFSELSVSPNTLWPANHKYVDVTATVVAVDNFDPNPTVTLISVTSNEPDNGLGDGDTANDIVIVDDFTFQLRAERSGTGTGRIYTITYQVTDACGNSTIATATVTVPHSQKKTK